jgi:hypothetical protein
LTVYDGRLIAGGDFTTAGGVPASYIACWDGNSWQPLGNGMNGPVYALTVYNGQLIAGGAFIMAGGAPANCIACWNGNFWQPVGIGMNLPVLALTVYNGQLIAGGQFTMADGLGANYIAYWIGPPGPPLGWHQLGFTGMNAPVFALTVYNDALIAGGAFTTADIFPANHIARWIGPLGQQLGWQPPSGIGMNAPVYALTVYDNKPIAGGNFTNADGTDANYVARWNGSFQQLLSWQPLGSGMNAPVRALTAYNGRLIAAGLFTTASGIPANMIASWGLPIIYTYAGDLNHDCCVDLFDFGWFAQQWLHDDCMYNGWCYEADLNYDFMMDFEDLAKLADNWLKRF